MFLFLDEVFGSWRVVEFFIFIFIFFDTWWEERRIKCACFLKKTIALADGFEGGDYGRK